MKGRIADFPPAFRWKSLPGFVVSSCFPQTRQTPDMNNPKTDLLQRWDQVETETLTPWISRQMIHGDRIMLAQIHLKKGCVVPLHQHDNEQFSYVLEGKMRLWVGKGELEEIVIESGEVLHLPSNVPHKAEALVDTRCLDVFSPPRQDWIDGTDAYLRSQLD
jgi:quercetin dioxygenase-like cupin family protein